MTRDNLERAERKGRIAAAVFLFFIVGALVMGGCARIEARDPDAVGIEIPRTTKGSHVLLWVDPVTGCEYLWSTNGGFIPRYDRSNGYHHTIKGCRA